MPGDTGQNFALQDQSRKPPILVVGARIDPVAATAEYGPWADAFLEPEGQEGLQVSTPKIPFVRPGWDFEERESSNLREP